MCILWSADHLSDAEVPNVQRGYIGKISEANLSRPDGMGHEAAMAQDGGDDLP